MTKKDKSGKVKKEKQKKPQTESTASKGKHPDQKQAEQEEARTIQAQKATKRPPQKSSDQPGKGSPQKEGSQSKEPEEKTGTQAEAGEKFPIVGIGASAGGLNALETFFAELPEGSGLAFAVVTHTDPQRSSMLPELIERKSKIPVQVIEEGMSAAPNMVYIPPSDRDAILKEGVFHLKKRPGRPELHMPVDLFLRHLAEDRGDQSACAILSGTGTDGSQGLRLIKEKGGFVIAQSEASASHGGMPVSAMQTGLVDAVLDPKEMPGRLIQYFTEPMAIQAKPEAEGDKTAKPLNQILAFLANRTRHDFSLYKENTLIRRVERRMTITHSRNAAEYLKLLRDNREEVNALFQDLLIGVTNFFRDPEAFSFLKKEVVSSLVQSEDQDLRIWVPGCATGEEAYSVAIVIQETLEENEDFRNFQLFGTDIDPRAIEQARLGVYVQNIVTDVGPDRLERFFVKEDSTYRVKKEIREQIIFAEQNVLEDPPFSNVDLVVCRNLLIYLKPSAQDRLIPLFHYAIRNSGFLFLGTSEGVGSHHQLFKPLSKQFSIYQKKDNVIAPRVEFPTGSRKLVREERPSDAAEATQATPNLGQAAERVLMEQYTPPSVVINDSGDILHFHGHTGTYLEPAPGSPTVQITDMARVGLRVPLLSALRRARQEQGEIREPNVQVKTNGEYKRIDLVVRSFKQPPLKGCRMVIFHELPESSEPEEKDRESRTSPEEGDREQAAEREHELMRLREDYRSAMEELQTSNEELRSTNEEMQSSNEELQSTNEELESSREELQSLNEELNTVNSELHSKMQELKGAYEAISSVLNSTRVAIVFLNKDLNVERFTPEAGKLLNLIDTDIGRPMEHISHNLKYEGLSETAESVMKTLKSVNEEVQTNEGNWYRMRIMLYRPAEHVIEGVVLTFINIDAEKEAQKTIEEMSNRAVASAKQFAEAIVDTVRESLLVLDEKMRVVTANRSFYDTFRTSEKDTEQTSLFELRDGQWDIPELKKLLKEVVSEGKVFQGYLVEHRFPDIGPKKMLLNARMLREEEGQNRILLAMEDVTEKPAASQKATS